ncbi:hypothetical protein HU200_046443 [Digitaria exilis]|uniref:Uncharacterized protein n=1 Tax=Digitaria exilis TaxID=1010633 RepID=A0A835EB55_9POAL|nr:hypothetical protein HU200_046443 [Digitaria exilis]
MADDAIPDPDEVRRQLEERLRGVGERLQAPPDEAQDLLQLLKVSLLLAQRLYMACSIIMHLLYGRGSMICRVCPCRFASVYRSSSGNDIFSLIVGTFQHLDDIESPSFKKRVTILDTVAKVRSCVVMLDLECDDLINDIYFNMMPVFNFSVSYFSSQHPDSVISCMETIMRLVIEESEDVQPQIASCLLQNVRKEEKESSSPSFELAKRVIDSCREKLKPVFLQSLKGTSLSEYSQFVALVCEGGSDDMEDNNADPSGKDTVDDGKPSERTISDELPEESSKVEQDVIRPEQDAAPADTGESNQVLPSTKGKPLQPCYTENIIDADKLNSGHREGTEPIAAEPKNKSAIDADKSIKLNPSDKSEATAHSGADVIAADTSKHADITPVKPRRGRPPGAKSLEKKAAGKNKPISLDSAGKLTKRSAKDAVQSSEKKANEGESSKNPQKNSLKHQKDDNLSEEDPANDMSLKEMISAKSLTKRLGRTKGQSNENSTSKREQEQETEELPRSRKNKRLDGSLVGARIKVWWPDDKIFYNGVVESFDSDSKRHKVAYDDGDVEVLLLRDEKWEFISEEKGASVASETPRGRKRKGEAVKEENTETPKSDAVDPPKKRGRPKGWRSSNGTPSNNSASTSAKGKTARKDVKETPKTGSNRKNEVEKSSKDKVDGSTQKTKDGFTKDGDGKSSSKPKETSSEAKDSKDIGKSNEGKGRPGRKPKNASDADKEKQEKEGKTSEIEQEATANASAGKKRRRKA